MVNDIYTIAATLWTGGTFFMAFIWAMIFGFAIFSYRSIRRAEQYRG